MPGQCSAVQVARGTDPENPQRSLVGHISRDSTAIEAREKPVKPDQPVSTEQPKRKHGRPRKGEVRQLPPPSRIERQPEMAKGGVSAITMLVDLPRHCDVGTKQNAKGHEESWIGYELHIDTADGGGCHSARHHHRHTGHQLL